MVATARICRSLNLYVYTMFLYEGLNKKPMAQTDSLLVDETLFFRPQAFKCNTKHPGIEKKSRKGGLCSLGYRTSRQNLSKHLTRVFR